MTQADFPEQGVVFWPVGTGDSTTIVVKAGVVVQVDLRDQKAADEDGAVVAAVVDRLVEQLPRPDGETPYLAVFALTHADKDHCQGFGDLLDSSVHIGEIWATPRLWREIADDTNMCEDAERFHQEVERRVKATLEAVGNGKEPASGDRIRIIGYDDDHHQHSYADLSDDYLAFPGHVITTLNGHNVEDQFEAFVHGPFRDDCDGDRNGTSLALQVQLHADDGTTGRMLLLGDMAYETLMKVFENSEAAGNTDRLGWDVLLAPHHCSKKVMYAPGEDGSEELKQDILDKLATYAGEDAYVIASALPFRDRDESGHNPPHLLARDAYADVTGSLPICTGEYPDSDDPRPVVFTLEPGLGLDLVSVEELEEQAAAAKSALVGAGAVAIGALLGLGVSRFLAGRRDVQVPGQRGNQAARAAVAEARGDEAAPPSVVGFGAA